VVFPNSEKSPALPGADRGRLVDLPSSWRPGSRTLSKHVCQRSSTRRVGQEPAGTVVKLHRCHGAAPRAGTGSRSLAFDSARIWLAGGQRGTHAVATARSGTGRARDGVAAVLLRLVRLAQLAAGAPERGASRPLAGSFRKDGGGITRRVPGF